MKRILGIILFLCIAILFPSWRSSAVMIGMGTEELTRESSVVIRGEVAAVKSQWSDDGKTIITRASVKITDTIRGETNSNMITVEYAGGEVGEMGLWVEDVSPLKTNENVILFLKPIERSAASAESGIIGGVHRIVGKAQGKYTISKDGIAEKSGFSVMSGEGVIDNNIAVDELINKIRRVK